LKAAAPEAFDRRGPWSRIAIEEIEGDEDEEPGAEPEVVAHLRSAWAAGRPEDRLAACAKAIAGEPHNAALRLAEASVHMEIGSLPPAQEALDRALAIDAGWEAAWFEYGKLWLRADDLERAAERFAEAARLMPSFAAALSNLGAALGELDRPDDALAALRQALEHDPRGHLILNNIGVLCREQGQLDEAVRAGQDVIGLAPAFVFGYYNLAHALFLQGRFGESRDAYAEGVSRDAQRNPVQACRYAVSRAAAGETSAAIAQIRTLAAALPQELRDRVLGEAEETLAAVAGLGTGHAASVHEVQVAVRELATRRN
jgi:tetratricopeptide (TPR) repeat protein